MLPRDDGWSRLVERYRCGDLQRSAAWARPSGTRVQMDLPKLPSIKDALTASSDLRLALRLKSRSNEAVAIQLHQ